MGSITVRCAPQKIRQRVDKAPRRFYSRLLSLPSWTTRQVLDVLLYQFTPKASRISPIEQNEEAIKDELIRSISEEERYSRLRDQLLPLMNELREIEITDAGEFLYSPKETLLWAKKRHDDENSAPDSSRKFLLFSVLDPLMFSEFEKVYGGAYYEPHGLTQRAREREQNFLEVAAEVMEDADPKHYRCRGDRWSASGLFRAIQERASDYWPDPDETADPMPYKQDKGERLLGPLLKTRQTIKTNSDS